MLIEDLARSASVGKQTDIILLDFSKAFDKVNHSKLLWKLHQYGIRGHVLDWVKCYMMLHYVWNFTVCQSTCLGVSCLLKVNV